MTDNMFQARVQVRLARETGLTTVFNVHRIGSFRRRYLFQWNSNDVRHSLGQSHLIGGDRGGDSENGRDGFLRMF